MTHAVLLLGAGAYYCDCIQAAKRTGYHIICVDRDPQAPGQHVAHEFYPVDFSNKEAVLALARDKGVAGVVPLNDYGVPTAAYVASKLGLPGVTEETAAIAIDKLAMRDCWEHAGLPNPKYALVSSIEEAQHFMAGVPGSVILKPANSLGGGSRGVSVVQESSELEAAYVFASKAYSDGRVLIEQCVEGIEHSAEVLVMNGEATVFAIADKVKTPYPYRVDEKVVYPTQVTGQPRLQLEDMVKRATLAIGITHGPAHVELVTTEKGPVLFEIGARCGGGSTAEPITSYVSGYSYFENVLRCFVGDPVASPPEPLLNRPCIYGFFTVENQEAQCLKPMEDFIAWEVFSREDLPTQTQQGRDRLGYYVFQGTVAALEQLKQPQETTPLH